MAILITGVGGFIGFHVAHKLLARGEAVIGIDNLNDYYLPRLKEDRIANLRSINGDSFSFFKIDFADMDAVHSALANVHFDTIVHLGAQAGVRYSIDNPGAYAKSNLVGHLNMLEVARNRSVRHFVYASSSSVYGGNDRLPFSVDDPVDHPMSLYAATKRADELISESYSHLYRIPQTGLRFFTVYGPWGRPDMAMWIFTKAIFDGNAIEVFNNGDMRRDFTFIDDIVAGVIASLDNPPPDDGSIKAGGSKGPHRLYNIGNNRSERLMDMIALLEKACGKKAQLNFQPMQPGDVRETHADIDAIQSDLGYAPTTPISVGIPRFVEWYRDYHASL